jgi:hypothetical protein
MPWAREKDLPKALIRLPIGHKNGLLEDEKHPEGVK